MRQQPVLPAELRLYARVARTRSLGPFQRFGLWVQGCPLRCPNCMTPGSLPFDGGELVPIDSLTDEILAVGEIEGLTVSGGEPFAQAAGLAALVYQLRVRRDLGLIVYTGYRLRALRQTAQNDGGVAMLLALTDLLIDGPYIAARNDGAALRGSSNQRVFPLTGRYLASLDCYTQGQPRSVEVHVDVGERMLVGIPSVRQLAWWKGRKGGCS